MEAGRSRPSAMHPFFNVVPTWLTRGQIFAFRSWRSLQCGACCARSQPHVVIYVESGQGQSVPWLQGNPPSGP